MERRPPSLPERLRTETREEHLALESVLPLAQGKIAFETYRDHLQFLLGFFEPMEARLQSVAELEDRVPKLSTRWKAALLRRDLGALDGGERAPAGLLPEPHPVARALGILYVLEGSSLGARTLLARLTDADVIPGEVGSEYLAGYGAETGRLWQEFRAALERTPAGEAETVVAAARDTFEALRDWHRVLEHRVLETSR